MAPLPQVVRDNGALQRMLTNHGRALGMLPALLVVGIGFHLSSGGLFLTAANLSVLLRQVAVNAVLASGMTFVILAGGIDLSVSAILAAAAVAGLITSHSAGLAWLWVLASLAVGVSFGLLNGLLISSLRLPPFIVTLASSTVVLGIARAATGDLTIYGAGLPYAFIGDGSVFGVPMLTIIGAIVIGASWFILGRTVFGLSVYAVGGNQAAARLSGVNVRRVHLAVYGTSGLLSGVAATMVVSEVQGTNPMQVGQYYTLDAITAVILGGTSFAGGVGSIWGTLTGALLIVALADGLVLSGVSDMWQSVIKGLVIIGAVTLDRARLVGSART